MKRGILFLAFGSLLLVGCSSGSSSQNSAKGESGFLSKISKAYNDGAKHRETTFKAEKNKPKDCIDVEYLTEHDTKDSKVASKRTMFKVKVQKRSKEYVRSQSGSDYYSHKTKSASSAVPCSD